MQDATEDGSEGSDGEKRGISWNLWNPTASLCDENVVSWQVWERPRMGSRHSRVAAPRWPCSADLRRMGEPRLGKSPKVISDLLAAFRGSLVNRAPRAEHLNRTQEVGGSNPLVSTKPIKAWACASSPGRKRVSAKAGSEVPRSRVAVLTSCPAASSACPHTAVPSRCPLRAPAQADGALPRARRSQTRSTLASRETRGPMRAGRRFR